MELLREIIVDNFAGGGGASTGIELAIGRSVDIAINHDPAAIAMHKVNHPLTEHYNENIWDIDPREVVRGQPVSLCWLSPDCTHFSKAKGGKPREKKIRGLAWVALRWAATVRPRVIMLENVEEFQDWGPLTPDGFPDKKQKGRTFKTFVNALKRQGYKVDWRELRACDYGAPTIRKRLFLVARRDGGKIVWPKPTHGAPDSVEVTAGKLKPWRTAAEIIDWSLPCPSIFTRKRPLAENTMRRIARGIQKFIIDNPNPFVAPYIIKVNHGGEQFRGQSINEPLQTITAKNGWGLVTPVMAVNTSRHPGSRSDEPLRTITTGNHHMLVAAFLAQYYTETQPGEVRGQRVTEPIYTIPTANRYALITSNLMITRNNQFGQPITEPIPTITAGGGHVAEVRSFLMAYYGSSVGQPLDNPLGTVTTKDRFGLVTIHGIDYQIVDIGMRMLEPHELFAAQGFPPEYIIDRDVDGKKYPKSAQVARCGNSVPPPFAEALVRANLPKLCRNIPYLSEHQLELQLV